jgi:hypothetical protein
LPPNRFRCNIGEYSIAIPCFFNLWVRRKYLLQKSFSHNSQYAS